jgi:hypothetical protein
MCAGRTPTYSHTSPDALPSPFLSAAHVYGTHALSMQQEGHQETNQGNHAISRIYTGLPGRKAGASLPTNNMCRLEFGIKVPDLDNQWLEVHRDVVRSQHPLESAQIMVAIPEESYARPH